MTTEPQAEPPEALPARDRRRFASVLARLRPRRRAVPVRRALRHAGLLPVLALAGMLDFYKLSQNGFANLFYAAAVKSDLLSLSNFFFVSFDPGGLDSIDKPRSPSGSRR